MSFRWRLLLMFAVAVAASVGVVEWLVTNHTRDAFERMESRRVDALVQQFRREYERRRQEIARAVTAIADSEDARDIAMEADPARYYTEAGQLASTHGLDLLELVAEDRTIVSSAEWPARFGYREEWLAARPDWKSLGAFLRQEELPGGMTLALVAVGTAVAGDRKLYVAGGEKLDEGFLSTLVLPAGMRALLYRSGSGGQPPQFQPLIDSVMKERREIVDSIGTGAEAETFHAVPLKGYEDNLLAVLLIGSSRRDLVELESSLRRVGILVAGGGILLGVALSFWASVRVSRPVRRLAESAGKVAAGNWGVRVETTSGDEIGRLGQAFNRMTGQLVEQRDRLVQAERVAAWRELARRLAHELKNPLFPLQITVENMQRARESYPDQFDEVFREGTTTLLAELSNLKQIIARFSDFAKMPAPEMQAVDLNGLTSQALKLFDAQLAEAKVEARAELEPKLSPVQADPEQITRVLRNLILNAVDAMPEGGKLTIRTQAVEGGGARLEVADTGQGLTPEECERLFTPYYTTKTHGTGLGLAIVQSVVSDHKGRISVESQPGKGTTFRIELG
jgi:two-component system nitrogen regulation sensor histidine kinase NtrY